MSAETCVFAQLQSGALPTELSEAGCATRPRYFKMEARRRLRLLGPALVWASRSWGVRQGRTGVLKIGRSRLRVSGVGMGPEHADGAGVSMANESTLSDIVSQMREATMRESRTALMDEDLSGLSVPDPRILIVGCGGSGNNTLNRITHLGVNGASTVAINQWVLSGDMSVLSRVRQCRRSSARRHGRPFDFLNFRLPVAGFVSHCGPSSWDALTRGWGLCRVKWRPGRFAPFCTMFLPLALSSNRLLKT